MAVRRLPWMEVRTGGPKAEFHHSRASRDGYHDDRGFDGASSSHSDKKFRIIYIRFVQWWWRTVFFWIVSNTVRYVHRVSWRPNQVYNHWRRSILGLQAIVNNCLSYSFQCWSILSFWRECFSTFCFPNLLTQTMKAWASMICVSTSMTTCSLVKQNCTTLYNAVWKTVPWNVFETKRLTTMRIADEYLVSELGSAARLAASKSPTAAIFTPARMITIWSRTVSASLADERKLVGRIVQAERGRSLVTGLSTRRSKMSPGFARSITGTSPCAARFHDWKSVGRFPTATVVNDVGLIWPPSKF